MRKSIIGMLSLSLCLTILVTSCNKKEKQEAEAKAKAETEAKTTAESETASTTDENRSTQESVDQAVDDVNKGLSDVKSLGGKVSGELATLLQSCGVAIDSALKAQGILKLTFDGVTNCNGRIRSGVITATLVNFTGGAKWKEVGAKINYDYSAFKVTRVSDNKSITLNGTGVMENESGGNWVNIVVNPGHPWYQANLRHKVTMSNIAVTHADGKTSTFNVSRRYTWTYSSNPIVLTLTADGLGTYNGLTRLENWGIGKNGAEFTSQVKQVVVWNTTCKKNIISGQMEIAVPAKQFSFLATFGVDATGAVQATGCPYGFKVDWKYQTYTGSKIHPY